MTIETTQKLMEQLSLEFVLVDSSDPDSLVELLPVLKKIKKTYNSLSFNDKNFLKAIKKAIQIIKDIKDKKVSNIEKTYNSMSNLISEMESIMHSLINTDPDTDAQLKSDTKNNKTIEIENAKKCLDEFAKLVSQFCPGEIPDLGAMLNICDELSLKTKFIDSDILHEVVSGCKNYLETMTLENLEDTKPIEEGILLVRAFLNHAKTDEVFMFDTSDVMELLNKNCSTITNLVKEEQEDNPGETTDENIQVEKEPETPQKISDDDLEILSDFISEAGENLDSIEVSLIELENDPTDNEIINNIFRPFHTIKGVSGFLGLKKINTLAHATENLLDSARSGDFLINEHATDLILESVDTLKKLLQKVEEGMELGIRQDDREIDIDILEDKLKKLQISLSHPNKQPLGEILVEKGIATQETIDEALASQINNPDKKLGEILIRDKNIAPKEIASALRSQSPKKKKIATQVKVNTEKLDNLVDYAGELVIAQSMLRQSASKDPALQQSVAQFGQIVTSMQNLAMSMRMIPIKATFMKMIRLVRDLSQKSGKKVDLNMSGEETEIDRNVVDALYEPMVHMIRNSVDHGIESKQARIKNEKPETGNIALRAYHKGGNIMIEIEDDGKGLDKFSILEKAIDTNLIPKDAELTDEEIYNLIMEPGFSTAKEITDISGRGVGMDVVKGGIEKFRGQLSIDSFPGKGTKFTISLPLTLAIIDGMLVRVGKEKVIIPTTAIKRSFKPEKENCSTIKGKGEIIQERGSLIPLVRLKTLYGFDDDSRPPWESLVVVVESKNEQRGLIIDELLGKDEYVIKSLGANLENIDGFAGGAILSDGRVGLILDIHGLFELISQ